MNFWIINTNTTDLDLFWCEGGRVQVNLPVVSKILQADEVLVTLQGPVPLLAGREVLGHLDALGHLCREVSNLKNLMDES